jgi:hypothetical protein
MDPNGCLIALLEAIEAQDSVDADTHLANLMDWMAGGGFAPNCQAAIETLRERMLDTPDNASGDSGSLT